MREIMFRRFNPLTKEFEFLDLANHTILTSLRIPSEGSWDHLEQWEQYTGLKDKNGKEIYFNSDVVSFKYVNNNGTIEMFEGTFNYCEDELRVEIDLLPKYYDQGYICLSFENQKMKDFQIIGNIHGGII